MGCAACSKVNILKKRCGLLRSPSLGIEVPIVLVWDNTPQKRGEFAPTKGS